MSGVRLRAASRATVVERLDRRRRGPRRQDQPRPVRHRPGRHALAVRRLPQRVRPAYISGGSSSGSAVAVAAGLVSFSLGTDTAGSGRVPAAFNNIVGLKPTRGLVSTAGVVPACRTLDCVSVFARTCADAEVVLDVIEGHDPADAYSRPPTIRRDAASPFAGPFESASRRTSNWNSSATPTRPAFAEGGRMIASIDGRRVEIDYAPFDRAAQLLYEGPWVAERVAGDPAVLRGASRRPAPGHPPDL